MNINSQNFPILPGKSVKLEDRRATSNVLRIFDGILTMRILPWKL